MAEQLMYVWKNPHQGLTGATGHPETGQAGTIMIIIVQT